MTTQWLCSGLLLVPLLAVAAPSPGESVVAPAGEVVSGAVSVPQTSPDAQEAAAEQDEDLQLFAAPTRRDRIGRIVVAVLINGKGPFRFIVDTGASHSTVSPALVQKLGLTPSTQATIELNGITGTARVPAVTIDRLVAGDLSVEGTDFPVVWAPVLGGADGILGAAGLSAQRLMVDFRRNRVVLSRADRRSTPDGFVRVPANRVAGGLITVQGEVGGVPVRAVIDTGSERTLGNLALEDALKKRRRPIDQQTRAVFGATDQIAQGDSQVAPVMVIGPLRITDVTLVCGDFHIFSVWGMEDVPALIIGMDILGTVPSMGIDFKHHDLYIGGAPPPPPDALTPSMSIGVHGTPSHN